MRRNCSKNSDELFKKSLVVKTVNAFDAIGGESVTMYLTVKVYSYDFISQKNPTNFT